MDAEESGIGVVDSYLDKQPMTFTTISSEDRTNYDQLATVDQWEPVESVDKMVKVEMHLAEAVNEPKKKTRRPAIRLIRLPAACRLAHINSYLEELMQDNAHANYRFTKIPYNLKMQAKKLFELYRCSVLDETTNTVRVRRAKMFVRPDPESIKEMIEQDNLKNQVEMARKATFIATKEEYNIEDEAPHIQPAIRVKTGNLSRKFRELSRQKQRRLKYDSYFGNSRQFPDIVETGIMKDKSGKEIREKNFLQRSTVEQETEQTESDDWNEYFDATFGSMMHYSMNSDIYSSATSSSS